MTLHEFHKIVCRVTAIWQNASSLFFFTNILSSPWGCFFWLRCFALCGCKVKRHTCCWPCLEDGHGGWEKVAPSVCLFRNVDISPRHQTFNTAQAYGPLSPQNDFLLYSRFSRATCAPRLKKKLIRDSCIAFHFLSHPAVIRATDSVASSLDVKVRTSQVSNADGI